MLSSGNFHSAFVALTDIFRSVIVIYFVMTASIVHEHAVLAYEVSMEILNFEVIDLNRLIELLNSNGMNERCFAISQFQVVVRFQIDRRDPALVVHIERMLGGAGNRFIANLNVDKLILFIQEGSHHALQDKVQ